MISRRVHQIDDGRRITALIEITQLRQNPPLGAVHPRAADQVRDADGHLIEKYFLTKNSDPHRGGAEYAERGFMKKYSELCELGSLR